MNIDPLWQQAGKTDKTRPSKFFNQKRIRTLIADVANNQGVSVEELVPQRRDGGYWVVAELEPLYRESLKGSSKEQREQKERSVRPKKEHKTTNAVFSEDLAFFLLESSEPFPVDLDDAIEWWDCRTKEGNPMRRDNIVAELKADFIKDIDYIAIRFS